MLLNCPWNYGHTNENQIFFSFERKIMKVTFTFKHQDLSWRVRYFHRSYSHQQHYSNGWNNDIKISVSAEFFKNSSAFICKVQGQKGIPLEYKKCMVERTRRERAVLCWMLHFLLGTHRGSSVRSEIWGVLGMPPRNRCSLRHTCMKAFTEILALSEVPLISLWQYFTLCVCSSNFT